MDVIGWPVVAPGVFGSHEVLHVLVIAGTAAHFVFIVRYVVPHRQPKLTPAVAPEPPVEYRRAA